MIVNGKRRTGRQQLHDTAGDQLPVLVLEPVLVLDQNQKIASSLLARFPEFARSRFMAGMEGFEVEGPYVVVGSFGSYLADGLVEGTLGAEEVGRAFAFLNELGENEDVEVQNLLQVGVLEALLAPEVLVAAARGRLTGGALELFEKTVRIWQ